MKSQPNPNHIPYKAFYFPSKNLQEPGSNSIKMYEKKNHPKPVHQALESKPQNAMTLGFWDTANFGKYKWKSFYDIANAGDYKYLRWLLSGKITLSASCRPHVLTALLTEGSDAQWSQNITELPDSRSYVWTCNLEGEDHMSPKVTQYKCQECNFFKSPEVVDTTKKICYKCMNKHAEVESVQEH